MPTVNIQKFNGGHAESIRTFANNQCEENKNFDIFSDSHYLIPYPDTVAETVASGDETPYKMSDVIDTGTNIAPYIALGQAGASDANLKFFYKSGATDTWTTGAEQTAGTVVNNTLQGYKTRPFAIEGVGSNLNLLELTATNTITDRGTITGETTACKPFVHPEDNLLYIGAGDQIARYDGTNDIDSGTGSSAIVTDLLPTGSIVTSLTDYGTYLAIAVRAMSGKAIAYLWGRDTTLTTTQGVIDFGKGTLQVLENLGNILVGVVSPTAGTSTMEKIQIKAWAGGEVTTIKEIEVDLSGSATWILKAKSRDKLYFTVANSDCLYVVGKNKDGEWFVSKDRYVANGSTPSSVRGLSIIDDYMWIGYNDGANDVFFRTSNTYTNTSVYKTTINPSMPLGDRYSEKQMQSVGLAYTGASTGTTVLKYSMDGASLATLISDTNATGEQKTLSTNVISTNDALLAGEEIQFQIESTGGSKIKELKYRYDKLNEVM